MSIPLKRCLTLLGVVFVLGPAALAGAQADPQNYLFNSGQTIQPFFDGWSPNPDGSFEFHFGYLNRNYVEELHIPVGPNNHVTPADPDQGQPTYFYPRQLSKVFSVTVPADWGDRELVWQVTVNGEAHRAVGWLQPEWEIDANPGGNRLPDEVVRANQAPTLALTISEAATVGNPATLTAAVTDDGLPEPRARRGGGGANILPTFARQPNGPTLPLNVPQVQTRNRHRPIRTRVGRVNLTWTQLRGPAGARLAAEDAPDEGTDASAVTASFAQPGDYLFRVQASDGPATVTDMFAVTVR